MPATPAGAASPLPTPEFGNPPGLILGPSKSGAEMRADARAKDAHGSNAHTPTDTAAAARAAAAAKPLSGPPPKLTADDELILQIQTQHGEMADTISGYGQRRGTYLPLGAIARFLDLAIAISDDGHFASGWFLDPHRTLSLNLREGKLIVEGKEVPLGAGDAAAFEGELYIRAERLAAILPMSADVDLRASVVTIKTREPFPYELKAEREAARDKIAGHGHSSQRHYPRVDTPWRWIDWPIADVETRVASDNGTAGTRVENDIRLSGDIAKMTARVFASTSSTDGLIGARLELGRRDPDAGLLGPLKATEFQLGDVSTVSLPMGLRGVGGRGVFVTSAPIQHLSVFDTIDLRGDLPDGYEVELYRNNSLIGSESTSVNGQYAFTQVGVDFGVNVFRLVFYGPQGQRREEVRRISVGDGRLAKGAFTYAVGVAQKDVNLFDVKGVNFSPTEDYGAWRASALMEYGVSTRLTAAVGGAWFQSQIQPNGALGNWSNRWQAYAGLRSGIAGIAVKLDAGLQDGGGHALEVGLGGRLLGVSWIATHAEYGGGYLDEVRSATGIPLRRATDVDLNLTLHLGAGGGGFYLPISSHLSTTTYADGHSESDASLRTTLSVSRFVATNTLDYTRSGSAGGPYTSSLLGNFDLNSFAGTHTQYRAVLGYQLTPGMRLTNAGFEVDRAINERTTARLAFNHALTNGQSVFGGALSRRFDRFTLGFDGTYTMPDGAYAAMLRLGMSFGRNPVNGHFFMARPGLSGGGAVVARAFRDTNGDGRFDDGDTALPGVDFSTGSQHATTGSDGTAFLGGVGDGNRTGVVIDAASLPDITLAPASEGVEVLPRPGRIHVADFPVVELSDVEGTAYFGGADSGAGHAVSGLVLRVFDRDGKQVAHARTEADGYFLFEQLRPGDYEIRLDAGQAQGLKIRIAGGASLHIGAKSEEQRLALHVVSSDGK